MLVINYKMGSVHFWYFWIESEFE